MIKFENVFLKYVENFYSLYNFNCEINSHTLFIGDFFNGTIPIIRTLSKIDKDYKGNIFIDNINLKNIKDKDLNLVYLPENPILFKHKNIFKNLYFPLKIRKINKNSSKKLINSIFFELKNNNFDIFYNYFINNEIMNNNEIIYKILNIKVKNLNLSEQKILTLIRAVIRKPQFILLENFFENLDPEHIEITKFLLNKIKENSIIIACEKCEIKVKYFQDFKVVNLNENKEKKEE